MAQSAQVAAGDAEHEHVLPTPPPLRRHVGERAAAFAEEARALTERSTELLVRIDELFSAPADGSIEAPMSGAAC